MKNILITILKQLLKVFFIFPIKKNKIVFSAYSGKQYSCNPKYITEFMLRKYCNKCEMIWAFNKPEEFQNIDRRIKRVKYKSVKYLYHILTANVVVDNVESWSILPKRSKQLVINTWHGGGAYKGVGIRRNDASEATTHNMLEKNKRIDVYLSSSRFFTEHTLRQSFKYHGKVLEKGMPRNDILINNSNPNIEIIRNKIGVASERRIVMYAPSFRADKDYNYELNVQKVLEALRKHFGGEWTILFRGHYYIKKTMKNTIDVSEYPDMQELLLISDILITDYSSSMWDFSLMFRPCFLFVPDLDKYKNERDFYTPITSWPFPYAKTNEKLCELIKTFDRDNYIENVKRHHDDLKSTETGRASEYTSKLIFDWIQKGVL